MKALLFFLLLGTCVPALAAAAAAPMEPLITRSVIDDYRLSLTVANLEQERTLIQFHDLATSEELYTQLVREHNGFSVSLSLDELPEGRYAVTVTKGDTVRRQVIRKTDTGIQCSEWR